MLFPHSWQANVMLSSGWLAMTMFPEETTIL